MDGTARSLQRASERVVGITHSKSVSCEQYTRTVAAWDSYTWVIDSINWATALCESMRVDGGIAVTLELWQCVSSFSHVLLITQRTAITFRTRYQRTLEYEPSATAAQFTTTTTVATTTVVASCTSKWQPTVKFSRVRIEQSTDWLASWLTVSRKWRGI